MSTFNNRRCCKCGKTRSEDLNVTYHKFPFPGTSNILKARTWATYCWPDKDWTYDELCSLHNKSKILCGRHFSHSRFYDNNRQKLSKFAVPDSSDVEELLNMRENIFDPNREQTNTAENVTQRSSQPVQEIQSIMVQPSTSRMVVPTNMFVSPPEATQIEQNMENTVPRAQRRTTESLSQIVMQCPAGAAQAAGSLLQQHTVTQVPTTTEFGEQLIQSTKKEKGNKKRTKILETLGINRVKEMAPRERKLYKICRNKMRQIIKLKNNIKNKKGKLEKVFGNKYVNDLCDLKISNSFITLLQSQLQNCPRRPKGRRYTLDKKIQALVIYKKSPACYRLLRRMFALPCQKSLNQLLNKVPLKPGINNHIFTALTKKQVQADEADNLCILSFDEMSIRKHISYNQKTDEMEGYQDHANHGRTQGIATKALVFMLAGIRLKWKQPIAFYFSHTITADRMTVILKEVLTKCINSKIKVVATVCDMSTVNVKVLKNLGITTRDPYFTISGQEIVAMFDPPHLLKCTRNLFMKHDIECTTEININGTAIKGTAKWSHLEMFYELDKNSPTFVYAPQLTENHFRPNPKQQMKVNLAAHIFSSRVTAGLHYYINTNNTSNKLPVEANATTATITKKFDELFDAMNADTPDARRGKKYSTNMTAKSSHLLLFRDMKKFISEMKYIGSKSKPPSQEGWILTMNAIERLWNNLKKKIGSISTRRLNQDPLENCFGCIRYNCGSNNNPTIPQFVAGFKTAIISNLKYSGHRRNCEDDSSILSNNLSTFLKSDFSPDNLASEEKSDGSPIIREIEILLADAVEAVELATPESQACSYVCGFIFKKQRNNDCMFCKNAFLAPENVGNNLHIFTALREYEPNKASLNYGNEEFVKCVLTIAKIVHSYLEKESWKPNIKNNIMKNLECLDYSFLNKCETHFIANKQHIKNSTFYICIKRFCILKNREMDEEEKRKALERKIRILRNK